MSRRFPSESLGLAAVSILLVCGACDERGPDARSSEAPALSGIGRDVLPNRCATLGSCNVPPTAPDFVPAWVYADTNMILKGDSLARRIARNVLIVAFDPSATTRERSSAIESIGGVLIGGEREIGNGLGGSYYVRVDAPTRSDLHRLRAMIDSMPKVTLAMLATEFLVSIF